MGELEDLYRDIILDHFRSPRNRGALPEADIQVEGVNPLCGDQIQITLKLRDGQVEDVRFDGKGCSISQSSASMMTEAVKGKPLGRSQELVKEFKRMMLENGSADDLPGDLEELASLEGVKKYPVRIKCAVLPWNTLLEGLKTFEQKKDKVLVKHKEE
jgi:nitrogen fixation protein NifU and related proteins